VIRRAAVAGGVGVTAGMVVLRRMLDTYRETADRLAAGDDGSAENVSVLALAALGAVISVLTVVTGSVWPAGLVGLATIGAAGRLLARMNGICRACGHPGSWSEPLTVVRRPRVHVRHLPAMRASHRASRRGGAL
jgi:hypothetical protein